MRLIDADVFKETIGTDTKLRRMVCDVIDAMPTAFDVEIAIRNDREIRNKAIDDFLTKLQENAFPQNLFPVDFVKNYVVGLDTINRIADELKKG